MAKKVKSKKKTSSSKPAPITERDIRMACAVLARCTDEHFSRYDLRNPKNKAEILCSIVVGRCEHTAQAVYDSFDALQAMHDGFHEAKKAIETATAEVVPLPPGVLQDAPKATDIDADKTAPTITMTMYQAWFPIPVDGRMAMPSEMPPWCQSACLTDHVDEDHGRSLMFMLAGEDFERVAWVRS